MTVLVNVNILQMLILVRLKFSVLGLQFFHQLFYKTAFKYTIWELKKSIKIYLINIYKILERYIVLIYSQLLLVCLIFNPN
jgi:hypothetical protein